MKKLILILSIIALVAISAQSSDTEEWALILDEQGEVKHFFQMNRSDLKDPLTPEMELIYNNGKVIQLTEVQGDNVTITSATLYRGTREECLAKIEELGLVFERVQ